MKDIISIVFRLTVSCLLAGTVMGIVFIATNKAKKDNEHANEAKVTYSLLGYSSQNPAPDSMALHEIYRYVISENGIQSIGYLVPTGSHEDISYVFVRIDLDGELLEQTVVKADEATVREEGDRNSAIITALGAGKEISYAEKTIVATNNGTRVAYLIGGKFPGFKTFISVMLAVDSNFTLLGLEVMEHEEDPGLGGEIEQDYFKNQFEGKPFEVLKRVGVVKAPLPEEYFKALENDIEGAEREEMMEKYRDKDIYALTGATISTKAVSEGVRGTVKKFAYRVGVLDRVLTEQNIEVSF